MNDLRGKRIVLGLTGGIACYKSAELLRGLVALGARVDVVMTASAQQFITAVTMQALSGRPVYTDLWDNRVANNMAHIDLTRDADLILVAPCTTHFMAKVATGLADDLLSTLCLARNIPLCLAPAMNREMWLAAPTVRHAQQLQTDGVRLWGPDAGEQACGETGIGRMREPELLLADVVAFFKQNQRLQGKRVLITAGPTYEPIDPVRGITNRSSGKTGYAIAAAAAAAGAHVDLVSGPTPLSCPPGVNRMDVTTAQQMFDAVVSVAPTYDIFIAVAAVADWRVKTPLPEKIKTPKDQPPTLEFVANPDILATVAALPNAPWCVGFAAETHLLSEHATQKRARKNIPLLIANYAQHVMQGDTTEVTLFDDQGEHRLPGGLKSEVAKRIVDAIADRYTVSR